MSQSETEPPQGDGRPDKSDRAAPAPGAGRARTKSRAGEYLGSFWRSPWLQLRDLTGARIGPNLNRFLARRQPLVWLLALGIGLTVSYAAIGFRLAIGGFQLLWLGTGSERVIAAAMATSWWIILLTPVAGGLIVGYLLQFHVPGKRAHSVSDVIEARAVNNCFIPPRTGAWSAVLAVISLGFGASAGREGPIVHLGASIASFAEERFKLARGARRTLLACGVAAAVSASFNAPIAGVLFAHEVILAHYALSAFVPIVISSVTAAIISRLHFGNFPAFLIPDYQITTYWEFPAFALLGLTCAAVAIAFETSLMVTERVALRIVIPLWLRPVIGGFMIGAMALVFPQILGVGYEATDAALNLKYPLWIMLALIVAKAAATSITLASRFAGGIFSPSLYLGAMAGGAFGLMASNVFPQMASSHGLYAILGMGAVAASVLGAPLSTTLIVFELTRGFDITIALLLTVSISNGLTQAALGFSYFHWQLENRGISVQEGPHKEIMRHLLVRDFMESISDDESPGPRDPNDDSPWLAPHDSVETALRAFDGSGRNRIAVVDPGDSKQIIGWANRLAALQAYNKALVDAHVEGHL